MGRLSPHPLYRRIVVSPIPTCFRSYRPQFATPWIVKKKKKRFSVWYVYSTPYYSRFLFPFLIREKKLFIREREVFGLPLILNDTKPNFNIVFIRVRCV